MVPLDELRRVLEVVDLRRVVDVGAAGLLVEPFPEALRNFCETIGVARKDARVELATFEHALRDSLNMEVPRVLCVQHPLQVTLTNYPEGQVEELDASYYPHDVPKTGSRKVPFSRELWVDRDDFMEDAPKKFYRLSQGREVLRFGYLITCNEVPDLEKLLPLLARRATIVLMTIQTQALSIPYMSFVLPGHRLIASTEASRENHMKMLQFAARQRVKPWIEEFPMTAEGIAKAFEKLERGEMRYRGVLVRQMEESLQSSGSGLQPLKPLEGAA